MRRRAVRIARRPGRAQRGATLMVAMVMLVAIGLTSVAVMRGALSTDQMVGSTQQQTLARQAAETALHYCEQQAALVVPAPGFVVLDAPVGAAAEAWTVFANWYAADRANTVPAAAIKSSQRLTAPASLPRCIVQRKRVPSGDGALVVTVRGFSPDYAEGADRRPSAGAAVWLQSTLRLQPP